MTTENESTMKNDAITEFGAKLQAAREALGLERKDVAAQLRLNERFITMMETGEYATDVPLMFVRGYLRSYSKLLHLPSDAPNAILEVLKPTTPDTVQPVQSAAPTPIVTSKNYPMQMVTSLVVFTIIALVSTWWYSHTPSTTDTQALPVGLATNQQQPIKLPLNNGEPKPTETKLAEAAPGTITTNSITTQENTDAVNNNAKNSTETHDHAAHKESDQRDSDDDSEETESND